MCCRYRNIQAVALTAIPINTDIQVYTCHIFRYIRFQLRSTPQPHPRPLHSSFTFFSSACYGLTAECHLLLSLVVYHNRAASFRRLFSNFFSLLALARRQKPLSFSAGKDGVLLSPSRSPSTVQQQNGEDAAEPPIFSHLSLRMKK